MKASTWKAIALLLLAAGLGVQDVARASLKAAAPRRAVDLNGTWQVEQGSLDEVPKTFSHHVPVPGLLDMAQPAFDEVGKPSKLRKAFWYRRTFKIDGPVPEVASLKIHKACYGTKVILNGQTSASTCPVSRRDIST